jgi:hypothetical protein
MIKMKAKLKPQAAVMKLRTRVFQLTLFLYTALTLSK